MLAPLLLPLCGGVLTGLTWTFGTSQDQSNANAEKSHRLSDFQDVLSQSVSEFTKTSEHKFFRIENKPAVLNELRAETIATQNKPVTFQKNKQQFPLKMKLKSRNVTGLKRIHEATWKLNLKNDILSDWPKLIDVVRKVVFIVIKYI